MQLATLGKFSISIRIRFFFCIANWARLSLNFLSAIILVILFAFSSKITQRNNLSPSTYSSSLQNIPMKSFDRVVPEGNNTPVLFM